jgi:N-acetylmuramic acid 6-phosphate etherase
MKAGTAQKAVLNMFSTATMLRCGLVYRGLMVNMRISNEKLLHRGQAMVRDIAGVDLGVAERALEDAGLEIKRAVLIALGATKLAADSLLIGHDDDLRAAIRTWNARGKSDA